jgi:hypothetical protein
VVAGQHAHHLDLGRRGGVLLQRQEADVLVGERGGERPVPTGRVVARGSVDSAPTTSIGAIVRRRSICEACADAQPC